MTVTLSAESYLLLFEDPLPKIAAPGRGFGRNRPLTLLTAEPGVSAVAIRPGTAALMLGQRFIERACATADIRLQTGAGVPNRKILALAERLVAVTGTASPSDAVSYLLWIALARGVGRVFGGVRTRLDDGWLNPVAIQRTVEFVVGKISGEVSVTDMARHAGLSASAFLRAFRGSTGMTPGDYVLEQRVAHGMELLATTTLPVSSVAKRVGFKSGNHFATTFTARSGMSPSLYRRERASRSPSPARQFDQC